MAIYNDIILHWAADIEILQAYFWYENQKKGLGEKFKTSLNSKIKFIKKNPTQYSYIYKNLRSSKITKFPFNIIYKVSGTQIQIIAIFHHSRNPRQWKRRV